MCRIKYHKKSGAWLLIAKVKAGDFSDEWADEGLIDETVKDKEIAMTVAVSVDVTPYSTTKNMLYRAKEGKKGVCK